MLNHDDVRSTAEKLLEQAMEKKQQELLSKEEMLEFKKCASRLLSSRDGKFFWRKMMKIMRVNEVNGNFNPIHMASEKTLRNLHLTVMGLLDPEVAGSIERGE